MAKTAKRIDPGPTVRREQIACPNCWKSYQIDAGWLGASGRSVRCQSCSTRWFEPPIESENAPNGVNPVLGAEFPGWLKKYLQALPDTVKQNSSKSTHAIKTFLMRYGVGNGAVGFANGIKINLPNVKTTEFLWDAVGKVLNRTYPGEDHDLTFAAESENQPDINKIIEDANKLPIVRADARLMFFRANDQTQCVQFLDRLHDLFRRHRKSEVGDIYILAGMDMHTLTYMVRKLTLQRPGSNISPWEEF